jgi:hypothetical protein
MPVCRFRSPIGVGFWARLAKQDSLTTPT